MSRRLMLKNSAAEEDIPIGVNLFDPATAWKGYYDQRQGVGKNYLNYRSTNTEYVRTLALPYDSRYEFSVSYITVAGNTTGLALDSDGISVALIEAKTGAGVKSACQNAEESLGVKVAFVCFSITASNVNNVVWMRTA